MSESLYLVDAHSLIFQVFHALPEMTSPSGLPTNALFGFTKDMLYLRGDKKPDYLICAFDVPGKTFRDELYPEYKAHRAPMPDDLQLQIPLIQEMLEAMRIPVLGKEGFEADDLIATLAVAGAQRGLDVFLCSNDKDCRQLLGDRVRIFNLRKRENFDVASLLADWGVKPEQVIDLQTLVGDSVDNVPGVAGIGIKTAAQLLQTYGTLDHVLAKVDDLSAKRKENIRAALPHLELSRKLVTLDTRVALPMDWDTWRIQPWDAQRLHTLFRSWGFQRFAEQMREETRQAPEAPAPSMPRKPPAGSSVQGDLFATESNDEPIKAAWQATYHLVDTDEAFDHFFEQLKQQPRFAIDLETTDLEPRKAEIVGLAFSWKAGEGWYLPVRGPQGERVLDPKKTLARLAPLLEAPTPGKVNQNIKYDLMVFRQAGIRLGGVDGDSMVADYLLHAGERSHNMEVLADKHLHHRVIPITDLIGKGKKQRRMDEVAPAQIAEYAGEDADVAWRLCTLLEPVLQSQGLGRSATRPSADASLYLYDDLEIPLIDVLADMEFTGIRLDMPFLQRLGIEMAGQLATLERDIHELAGRAFNIASIKQLQEILFKDLKLKPVRKTGIKGDPSTDQESLEQLAKDHPLPKKLLEHRKIAKLKGTYVDALPELVNPETGRVHASFNQTVAATGRLSSSEPNLQNIPIRSDQGGQIRQAFLPEEGWQLLTADYSQIELRLLAQLSEDEEMRRAFTDDVDIHSRVAAQVFGVTEAEVTSEQRRAAKTINFGVIYGISAFGLAPRLEIDKEEAGKFIDAYFGRYPKVLGYQDRLLAECREKGYVSTMLGRRRTIHGIRANSTYKQRNQPEREAINMQIQGSAADLIKVAMLNIHRRLAREKRRARLLLQIHDELVFEVPPEETATVTDLVRDEMMGALREKLVVPLKVDMGVGPNWLDVV